MSVVIVLFGLLGFLAGTGDVLLGTTLVIKCTEYNCNCSLGKWTYFIDKKSHEAGACKKCSASGVTVTGTPNCCPVGQTCDQSGGGSCIAAEPGTGTNNPDCKKTTVAGCKIWCPFGTTCSAPDDTGKCMPVKKGTTTDTPSSSSSAQESSSEAQSTAHPPSTSTTRTSTTTTNSPSTSTSSTTTTNSPSTSTTSSTSTRSSTSYVY